MMYVNWLLMVPLSLVITLLCVLLAPVIVLFASPAGWLPNWLGWFQTPDNSLDGDGGWRTEHWQWRFNLSPTLATYIGRIGWLWRNPGYGFGAEMLSGNPLYASFIGDNNVNDDPGHEGWCLIKCQKLFQFVWVKRIAENKSIYVVLGWNIKGLVGSNQRRHIATFAFSPRLSKFTVKE